MKRDFSAHPRTTAGGGEEVEARASAQSLGVWSSHKVPEEDALPLCHPGTQTLG